MKKRKPIQEVPRAVKFIEQKEGEWFAEVGIRREEGRNIVDRVQDGTLKRNLEMHSGDLHNHVQTLRYIHLATIFLKTLLKTTKKKKANKR